MSQDAATLAGMFTCLASWPVTPAEAPLIPPHLLSGIRHDCALEATHARWLNPVTGELDDHECHCGARHVVDESTGRRVEAELVTDQDDH